MWKTSRSGLGNALSQDVGVWHTWHGRSRFDGRCDISSAKDRMEELRDKDEDEDEDGMGGNDYE